MSFIIDEDKLVEDIESHFILTKFRQWFSKKFGRCANLNFKNDNRMFHAYREGFDRGKEGLDKDWGDMSAAMRESK